MYLQTARRRSLSLLPLASSSRRSREERKGFLALAELPSWGRRWRGSEGGGEEREEKML